VAVRPVLGVMYTAFMMALTLTTVANVLVTMALAPAVHGAGARFVLGHRLAARTWAAIAVAGRALPGCTGARSAAAIPHLLGTLVALAVPMAAASNWTLLQHLRHGRPGAGDDMLPAVLIGACCRPC
jgi:drug/metabolite transporter (DMT)-like permease